MRTRRVRTLLLALGAVAALLFVLRPWGKDREVVALLERTARELSARAGDDVGKRENRMSQLPDHVLTHDAELVIAGRRAMTGREAIRRAAMELARAPAGSFSLAHAQVEHRGADRAQVTFDLLLSDSQTPDLHSETRRGRAELQRVDGRWLIAKLDISAAADVEPEARP